MSVEIKDIEEKTFRDLPSECAGCLYWEAPENFGKGSPRMATDRSNEIKRDWFDVTRRTMGSCGKIICSGGGAAGYTQYAFPRFFERIAEYSRELFPPSPDAILLSCLYILMRYQRKGLGTKLLQASLEDLKQRGYQAVETYSRDDSANNCSGPTSFYLENGFKKIRTGKWGNAEFSLMRFELT